jgi:exodeoxyribonuclease V gamma subunit
MAPGLTIHAGSDLDALTGVLGELLGEGGAGVLEACWTVVPSAQVRQWLDWQLGRRHGTSGPDRHDGVAANLRYLFPEEFVRLVETAALAERGLRRRDWSVASLALRLRAAPDVARSLEHARRLAQEIDELVRWRPDVVRGEEPVPAPAGEALRAYRALTPAPRAPLAQRDLARATLRSGRPGALPERVVLFGLATVPGGFEFARLVADLASHVEVHVLMPVLDEAAVPGRRVERAASTLDSWAREAAESLAIWRAVAPGEHQWRRATTDVVAPVHALGALQRSARAGVGAAVAPDASIEVIGACGDARQAELARDAVWRAIVEHGVAPHEVLVLCADPSRFAAALERHWGYPGDDGDEPRLDFELTEVDSTTARTRLHSSVELLDLFGGYATAEQVQAFCAHPAVARTIGLSGEESDRLWRLVEESSLTFGVSPAQRAPFGVYGTDPTGEFRSDAGTWQRLIDRITSVVVDPPSDDPGLGVPEDLGRLGAVHALLRLLDEHGDVRRAPPATLDEWIERLRTWMNELSPRDDDDSFERAAARAEAWLEPDEPGPAITYEEFVQLWRELAAERGQQRVFGRGGVTVARLTAMAFAPYRVVCVLGLDEGALPPATLQSAVLGARRVGDPDARHALLGAALAAVVSAHERLIVTFNDRDETSGRAVEPSVALVDLLESVARTTGEAPATLARTSSRHPFAVTRADPRAITSSFDPRFAGAPTEPAPSQRWPPGDLANLDALDFRELRSFLAAPAAHYLRRVLGATVPPDVRETPTVPPVALDHPRRARLQREYLTRLTEHLADDTALPESFEHFDHGPVASCADASCAWLHVPTARLRAALLGDERFHANVPPRLWQRRMQFDVLELAAYNHARLLGELAPQSWQHGEHLELGDGSRLTLGAASGGPFDVRRGPDSSDELTTVHLEAREGALEQWRRLLADVTELLVLRALGADARLIVEFLPGRTEPYQRSVDSRRRGDFAVNPRVTARFTGSPDRALDSLATLAGLYRRALHGPLPLFARTSVAAVAGALRLRPADVWTTRAYHRGEDQEMAHRLLFPLAYEDLVGSPDGALALSEELAHVLEPVEIAYRTQSAPADAEAFRPILARPERRT